MPFARIAFRLDNLTAKNYYVGESPGDRRECEEDLVPLENGRFRIGADPRLPERLTFGPVVNGRAVYADKDGCRYSSTFTR